ncbi:hypothetical protein [Peribacillus frigoritolerans]
MVDGAHAVGRESGLEMETLAVGASGGYIADSWSLFTRPGYAPFLGIA